MRFRNLLSLVSGLALLAVMLGIDVTFMGILGLPVAYEFPVLRPGGLSAVWLLGGGLAAVLILILRRTPGPVRPVVLGLIAVSLPYSYGTHIGIVPAWFSRPELLFLRPLIGTTAFLLILTGLGDRWESLGRTAWRILGGIPPRRVAGFSLLVSVLILLYTTLGADGIPHLEDSAVHLFQARVLASGHWVAEKPAHPEFFGQDFMVFQGEKWYSQYPPGHALFLVPGIWLSCPWMIGALQALGSLLLFWGFVRRALPGLESRLAWMLFTGSPFLLFMSGSYMSHTTALLCVTGLLYGLARLWDEERWVFALAVGFCAGWLALTRPFTALAVVLPVAVEMGLRSTRRTREILSIPGALAGAVIPLGIFLIYNRQTTGDPFLLGYKVEWGDLISFGFGKPTPSGPPHTLAAAFTNLDKAWFGLNWFLHLWPIPALAPAVLGFFLGRPGAWEKRCRAILASMAGLHFFYYYFDYHYGPRMLYETLPAWALLSATGIERIRRRLVSDLGEAWGYRVAGAATGSFLFGLVVGVPLLWVLTYGRQYWAIGGGLHELAMGRARTPALVFIHTPVKSRMSAELQGMGVSQRRTLPFFHFYRGNPDQAWHLLGRTRERLAQFPPADPDSVLAEMVRGDPPRPASGIEEDSGLLYENGFVHMGPQFASLPVLYAHDLGEHNRVLMDAYPERQAYRATRDGYRGPIQLEPLAGTP